MKLPYLHNNLSGFLFKMEFQFFVSIPRNFTYKDPLVFKFFLVVLYTCFKEVPKSPMLIPFKGSKIAKY